MIISVLTAFVFVLLVSGVVVSYRLRHQTLVRVKELQHEVTLSQSRVRKLAEELLSVQTQAAGLQKDLNAAEEARLAAVGNANNLIRKPVLMFASAFFLTGALLGGTVSGLWVSSKSQTYATQLEVRAQVAEQKASFFKEQFEASRQAYTALGRKLMEEMEQKLVVMTKLEMVLDHLIPKSGGRFVLNVDAMNRDRQGRDKTQSMKTNSAFPFAIPAF